MAHLYISKVNKKNNRIELNSYYKNIKDYKNWFDFVENINIENTELIYLSNAVRIFWTMHIGKYIEIFFDFDYLFNYLQYHINFIIIDGLVKDYNSENVLDTGKKRYSEVIKKFNNKLNSLNKIKNDNIVFTVFKNLTNEIFKGYIDKVFCRYAVKATSVYYFRIKNDKNYKTNIINFLKKIEREMLYVINN